jgi:hypothetical protein
VRIQRVRLDPRHPASRAGEQEADTDLNGDTTANAPATRRRTCSARGLRLLAPATPCTYVAGAEGWRVKAGRRRRPECACGTSRRLRRHAGLRLRFRGGRYSARGE